MVWFSLVLFIRHFVHAHNFPVINLRICCQSEAKDKVRREFLPFLRNCHFPRSYQYVEVRWLTDQDRREIVLGARAYSQIVFSFRVHILDISLAKSDA